MWDKVILRIRDASTLLGSFVHVLARPNVQWFLD